LFRNLPNLLTILRLLLIPFILKALWDMHYRLAVPLVFAAGFTDAADGYLARRFSWQSRLGSYLDPLADKALLVSLYVTLGHAGAIPLWLVWLVLGRDVFILSMVASGFVFTNIRSFPPSIWGKVSTMVQVLTALVVLLDRAFSFGPPALERTLIMLTAAVTAWSGVHYGWLGLRMLRQATTSSKPS
jgi:cardiolipin synthase